MYSQVICKRLTPASLLSLTPAPPHWHTYLFRAPSACSSSGDNLKSSFCGEQRGSLTCDNTAEESALSVAGMCFLPPGELEFLMTSLLRSSGDLFSCAPPPLPIGVARSPSLDSGIAHIGARTGIRFQRSVADPSYVHWNSRARCAFVAPGTSASS